jgi:hypothetical protein
MIHYRRNELNGSGADFVLEEAASYWLLAKPTIGDDSAEANG